MKYSKACYDLLCHLKYGGSLIGTRKYPLPWRYRTKEGNEISDATIIKLVKDGLLLAAYSFEDNTITFTLTAKGTELERSYAARRQQARQRGAG